MVGNVSPELGCDNTGMNAEETEGLIRLQRLAREKQLAQQKAMNQWRTFLEATPPNVSVTIDGLFAENHPQARTDTWSITLPEISLHCSTCDGSRIFSTSSDYLFEQWKFVTHECKTAVATRRRSR